MNGIFALRDAPNVCNDDVSPTLALFDLFFSLSPFCSLHSKPSLSCIVALMASTDSGFAHTKSG